MHIIGGGCFISPVSIPWSSALGGRNCTSKSCFHTARSTSKSQLSAAWRGHKTGLVALPPLKGAPVVCLIRILAIARAYTINTELQTSVSCRRPLGIGLVHHRHSSQVWCVDLLKLSSGTTLNHSAHSGLPSHNELRSPYSQHSI